MSAWSDFKANPSIGSYLDWVRSSYDEYDTARIEQGLTVGADVELLAGAAAEQTIEVAKAAVDDALDIGDKIANATLDIVRGLGGAIIDGLDSAYDAARNKMRGHEPDVVAGLVVASLSILTVVYLYHSAKTARDAF